VDMIIGGHSHTILNKPTKVNNILISQVGVGSDQLGRYDIWVDDDTNSVVKYKWKLIPITSEIASPDRDLDEYIKSFSRKVDNKYNSVLCKFSEKLTHPKREEETTLGNLVADAFCENAQADIMLVGSGSIRVKELGPLVTLKDFLAMFPYDDSVKRFEVMGSVLKKIFGHIMRLDNRDGEGECYQVNNGVSAAYSNKENKLIVLKINGQEVEDGVGYKIAMQNYHFNNSSSYLNVSNRDLLTGAGEKVVTTSAKQVLEEYLRNNQNITRKIEGRLSYV